MRQTKVLQHRPAAAPRTAAPFTRPEHRDGRVLDEAAGCTLLGYLKPGLWSRFLARPYPTTDIDWLGRLSEGNTLQGPARPLTEDKLPYRAPAQIGSR